MKTYIIFLRGINVSGQKIIKMADLRQLLGESFEDVKTYVQSGNIVLKSENSKTEVKNLVEDLIKSNYGFDVPALVKTRPEIEEIISSCTFEEGEIEKSYFVLFYSELSKTTEELGNPYQDDAKFTLTPNCVYLLPLKGYGRCKANNNFFERKLGVIATTRNYNTMLKLLTLSES